MPYVETNGIETYHEEYGSGPPIVEFYYEGENAEYL